MALFIDGQECPLCGRPMHKSDRRFGTSHFLAPGDDLWQYSDAVMHWDCYATWAHRPRFARMYFDVRGGWFQNNPHWGTAYSDEQVLVTVNPEPLVGEIDVLLADTGSSLRVALRDWEDWLGGEWFDCCNHEIEQEALAAVLPRLRSRMPTAEAVIQAAGLEPSPAEAQTVGEGGGLAGRIQYEFAFRKLAERAVTKGVVCPRCGRFSQDYEIHEVEAVSEEGPQSYLACQVCSGQFGPLDV